MMQRANSTQPKASTVRYCLQLEYDSHKQTLLKKSYGLHIPGNQVSAYTAASAAYPLGNAGSRPLDPTRIED